MRRDPDTQTHAEEVSLTRLCLLSEYSSTLRVIGLEYSRTETDQLAKNFES